MSSFRALAFNPRFLDSSSPGSKKSARRSVPSKSFFRELTRRLLTKSAPWSFAVVAAPSRFFAPFEFCEFAEHRTNERPTAPCGGRMAHHDAADTDATGSKIWFARRKRLSVGVMSCCILPKRSLISAQPVRELDDVARFCPSSAAIFRPSGSRFLKTGATAFVRTTAWDGCSSFSISVVPIRR